MIKQRGRGVVCLALRDVSCNGVSKYPPYPRHHAFSLLRARDEGVRPLASVLDEPNGLVITVGPSTNMETQVEKLVKIIREVRAVSVRSKSSPECGLRSGLTENAVPKQSRCGHRAVPVRSARNRKIRKKDRTGPQCGLMGCKDDVADENRAPRGPKACGHGRHPGNHETSGS